MSLLLSLQLWSAVVASVVTASAVSIFSTAAVSVAAFGSASYRSGMDHECNIDCGSTISIQVLKRLVQAEQDTEDTCYTSPL